MTTHKIEISVSERVYDFLTTYNSVSTPEQNAVFLFTEFIDTKIGEKTKYVPHVRVDVLEKLLRMIEDVEMNPVEDNNTNLKRVTSIVKATLGENADKRVIQKYVKHFNDYVKSVTGIYPNSMDPFNIDGFKTIIEKEILKKEVGK